MDEQAVTPPESAVIRQLARIDIHIRRRWWHNYKANPTWTFTKAIAATAPFANNQWSSDYSTMFHQCSKTNEGNEPQGYNPKGKPKGSPKVKTNVNKGKSHS